MNQAPQKANSSEQYDQYFEDGTPKLTLSMCCFLDVLGFSARIMNATQEEAANQLLNEFYTAHNEALNNADEYLRNGGICSKIFSDNIFLAKPIELTMNEFRRLMDNGEVEFATMMYFINQYQLDMALKGFFIRGGMTIGPLFMDDNSIFGEALIEAHELESKIAVNPIVLISNNLKHLIDIQKSEHTACDENPPHTEYIYILENGSYYLNYLSAAAMGGVLVADKIRQHKEQIEQELINSKSQLKVVSKFKWLANYHNLFCDLNSHLPGYSEDLKIQINSVKFENLLSEESN